MSYLKKKKEMKIHKTELGQEKFEKVIRIIVHGKQQDLSSSVGTNRQD